MVPQLEIMYIHKEKLTIYIIDKKLNMVTNHFQVAKVKE